jgi:flagellar basal-body rod modification protein FlgD
MASIAAALPQIANSAATNGTTTSNSASSQNALGGLGNTSTFLNLLVAQLQYQDPTNPVDGTTFVTQLAEFNDVEQNLAVRQDMDAVSEKYLGTSLPPSETSSSNSTNTPSTQSL